MANRALGLPFAREVATGLPSPVVSPDAAPRDAAAGADAVDEGSADGESVGADAVGENASGRDALGEDTSGEDAVGEDAVREGDDGSPGPGDASDAALFCGPPLSSTPAKIALPSEVM